MAEEPKLRCVNLCCKSMMVYGEDFEMDPEYEAETTDFWCISTSKGHGPDGSAVSMEDCCNCKRDCYQEY